MKKWNDAEKLEKGLTSGGRSDIINVRNLARAIENIDFSDIKNQVNYSEAEILRELNNSSIGKEIISVIEDLPVPIKFTQGQYFTGVRGEEQAGKITIYINNCKNIEWIARTIIHECTHFKYGIGNSQWAECVCIAQELKHARKAEKLSYADLRKVVTAVKEAYPEFNWRKGGYINGKRTIR